MTEEVKKLIESVEVWEYPIPLSFQSRPMQLIEKSDFDRVIKQLLLEIEAYKVDAIKYAEKLWRDFANKIK